MTPSGIESVRHEAFDHTPLNKALFAWPLGCVVIIALIWSTVFTLVEKERVHAQATAEERAGFLASAYAQQVARSIEQMEQITLDLQYDWKASQGHINLERRLQHGLYPPTSSSYITLIDKHGISHSSTLSTKVLDLGDRDYFLFHKDDPSRALRIGETLQKGRRSGRNVIRLSRRLDDAQGNFDGVVLISVDPVFFASFNDEASLGPHDLISIRHENGSLFVSEKGRVINGMEQVHITPPEFKGESGIMRMPAEYYKDNQARILAWKRHLTQPIISYVGLAESTLMADHAKSANRIRLFALISTLLVLMVGATGIIYSARLAQRKQQAEKIKNTFMLAIDAANEGFYMLRAVREKGKVIDFILEDCNERGAEIAGRPKDRLVGERTSVLNREWQQDDQMQGWLRAIEQDYYEDEIRFRIPGTDRDIWFIRKIIRSDDGLAITLHDISQQKLHQMHLMDLANKDALTELPNRHWINAFLPQALTQAATQGRLLAIFYIDLDGFKTINDTQGHQTGDLLLQQAASRLKSVMRPDDHIARLGGDEFTVILPNVSSRDEAAQVAHRIRNAFHKPFVIQERKSFVGTSIGISMFPQDGLHADELLQKADIAMYAAKAESKGQVKFYDERFYTHIKARLDIEQELESAIESDQFVIHYQPRANTATGAVTGLEALIRWQHPERGLIMPGTFIPIAESNGMILSIGQLVLQRVCAQLSQWRRQGQRTVPVSVNMSAHQLNAGGMPQLLASLLSLHELPGNLLEIEITESAMMSETADILMQVERMEAMGIRIHVDDFGTGYSSLARLQQLHVDSLKIDRAFTAMLGTSEEAENLVNTIVLMAKALKLNAIAEGIENAEQLAHYQRLQCDEVQGFYLAKPMPAEEVVGIINKGKLF